MARGWDNRCRQKYPGRSGNARTEGERSARTRRTGPGVGVERFGLAGQRILEMEGEDHIRPVTWEEWITFPPATFSLVALAPQRGTFALRAEAPLARKNS